MAKFSFKAIDVDGALFRGYVNASDSSHAVVQLQSRGVIPLRVLPTGASDWRFTLRRRFAHPSSLSEAGRVDLLKRLAALLEGGVAIEDALSILAQRSGRSASQHLVQELLRELREGAHLADAMSHQGDSFPPLVLGMVRAGETSGALSETLARLADYMQRSAASRQAIRSALIYPAILITTATFSILIVLLVVLPSLRPAIAESGGVLPLPTRIAFAASDLLAQYWWLMAALATGLAFTVRHLIADPSLHTRRDALLLRLPIVGSTIRQLEIGRFARTLGVLIEGGVALPVGLALAQPVLANAILAESVAKVTVRLREGEGLADPLSETGEFPELAVQLIRIGEATGRLANMLIQLADIFESEVRRTMERGLSILVPALTIGLGVLVAGIVASVVLALLNVNDFAR